MRLNLKCVKINSTETHKNSALSDKHGLFVRDLTQKYISRHSTVQPYMAVEKISGSTFFNFYVLT